MPYSSIGDFYDADFYEPDFVILSSGHEYEVEMSGGFHVRGKVGIRTNVDVETPLKKRRPTLSSDGIRNPVFVLYKNSPQEETRLKQIGGAIVPAITTRELEHQKEKKAKPLIVGSDS